MCGAIAICRRRKDPRDKRSIRFVPQRGLETSRGTGLRTDPATRQTITNIAPESPRHGGPSRSEARVPATIERVEYGVCSDLSTTHRVRGTVGGYHPFTVKREETEAEIGNGLAICEHPKRRKALPIPCRSETSPSTGLRVGNDTVPYNQTTTPPRITIWPITRVRTASPWHRLYEWDHHRKG